MTIQGDPTQGQPVATTIGRDEGDDDDGDEVQHQSDSDSEDGIESATQAAAAGELAPNKTVDVAASLKIEAEDADMRMTVCFIFKFTLI